MGCARLGIEPTTFNEECQTHTAVSPLDRARLSALDQIIVCSRAMMHPLLSMYRIPQLKDEKNDVVSDLKTLQRNAQNLLIRAQKLEAHKSS